MIGLHAKAAGANNNNSQNSSSASLHYQHVYDNNIAEESSSDDENDLNDDDDDNDGIESLDSFPAGASLEDDTLRRAPPRSSTGSAGVPLPPSRYGYVPYSTSTGTGSYYVGPHPNPHQLQDGVEFGTSPTRYPYGSIAGQSLEALKRFFSAKETHPADPNSPDTTQQQAAVGPPYPILVFPGYGSLGRGIVNYNTGGGSNMSNSNYSLSMVYSDDSAENNNPTGGERHMKRHVSPGDLSDVEEPDYGASVDLAGMDYDHDEDDDDDGAFTVYWQRWLMLFYMSMLNLLSDWTCYSVAPISVLTSQTYGAIEPTLLVTTFLAANAIATAVEPAILSRLGLRGTIILGAFLLLVGSLTKSGIPFVYRMKPNAHEEWRVYLGFFIVGLSQPLYQCTPALLSNSWFPEKERTMATGISLNANQLGIGCAFVFGTILVSSAQDIPAYFSLMSVIAAVLFLGCVLQFDDAPPTPPSGSARIIRGSLTINLPSGTDIWRALSTRHIGPAAAERMAAHKEAAAARSLSPTHKKKKSGENVADQQTLPTVPEGVRQRVIEPSNAHMSTDPVRPSNHSHHDDDDVHEEYNGDDDIHDDEDDESWDDEHEHDDYDDSHNEEPKDPTQNQPPILPPHQQQPFYPQQHQYGFIPQHIMPQPHQQPQPVPWNYGYPPHGYYGAGAGHPMPSLTYPYGTMPYNLYQPPHPLQQHPPFSNLSANHLMMMYPPTHQPHDDTHMDDHDHDDSDLDHDINLQWQQYVRLPPTMYAYDEGAEPIEIVSPHHVSVDIRDDQILLSAKACFSRSGFVHACVAFVVSGIVINTLSTYMDYLVRLGGAGREYVGIIGGSFQAIIMISSLVVGKYTDKTRMYYTVAIALLVFGAFALAQCGVRLDEDKGPELRLTLLIVAALVGPLQPVATELGVDVAYPLSENTVLVIQQLFSNLLSAAFIQFFDMVRDIGTSPRNGRTALRPQYTFSFYLLIVLHATGTVFFATFNGRYLRYEAEEAKKNEKEVAKAAKLFGVYGSQQQNMYEQGIMGERQPLLSSAM